VNEVAVQLPAETTRLRRRAGEVFQLALLAVVAWQFQLEGPIFHRQIMPLAVGGFLVHFLDKKSERERRPSIRERGIVLASGLMAGGALGGVFGAALRLVPGYTEDWIKSPFYDNVPVSQTVAALLFVALCIYIWRGSTKQVAE